MKKLKILTVASIVLLILLPILVSSCGGRILHPNGPMPAIKQAESAKRPVEIVAHKYDDILSDSIVLSNFNWDKNGRIISFTRMWKTNLDKSDGGTLREAGGDIYDFLYKGDSITIFEDEHPIILYYVEDGLIRSYSYAGTPEESTILNYDNNRLTSIKQSYNNAPDSLIWQNNTVTKLIDDEGRLYEYKYLDKPCKSPLIYYMLWEQISSPYREIFTMDFSPGLLLAYCGFAGEPMTKNIFIDREKITKEEGDLVYDEAWKKEHEMKFEFDSDGYVIRQYWKDWYGYNIDITYSWSR